MPRDIPVGNGHLLVTFDNHYQIRDLYFPHVGQENHAGNGPCRFGVHTDVPGHRPFAARLDQPPRLARPPAVPARHAHHQRQPGSSRAAAGAVLQRLRRLPPQHPGPQDQGEEPGRSPAHRPADAPPGLQHVRQQDRRHRLLRPGAAQHGALPRQAVHPGDVLRRPRA